MVEVSAHLMRLAAVKTWGQLVIQTSLLIACVVQIQCGLLAVAKTQIERSAIWRGYIAYKVLEKARNAPVLGAFQKVNVCQNS